MKLSIIVPIFNEAATAATLLDQIMALSLDGVEKEIVIIESGSTDGTTEIVRRYEERPGVSVIYEDKPRGKGAAVRRGLAKVTGDVVVIQDADLEYSVSDYPRLLEPFKRGEADIVFGSRGLDPRQRWQYRQFRGLWERLYGLVVNWGGLFYTHLFNLLYGTNLTDGATMFKLFRRPLLEGITLRSDVFDYDWELQGKLAKRGYKIVEMPVSYKARSRAEGKKVRFWRDGWRVLVAIVRYRFFD
mgnify:CR=1 FL=1